MNYVLSNFETWYIDTLVEIRATGDEQLDRTGTGTLNIFDASYKMDVRKENPLLVHRKLDWRKPINEMHGFLNAFDTERQFQEVGVPFWNGFGTKEPIYDKSKKRDGDLFDEYFAKLKKEGSSISKEELYKEFNALSYQEGYERILNSGIHGYHHNVVKEKGYLGPIYGVVWRGKDGSGVDQVGEAIEALIFNPASRRIVVDGYNPSLLPDPHLNPHENPLEGKQALPPCHLVHQYSVGEIPLFERAKLYRKKMNITTSTKPVTEEELNEHHIPKYYLDLKWYQRSWDFVLGAPANWMGYWSLLIMMARHVNMVPRFLKCEGSNAHIYKNHLEGVKEILNRVRSIRTTHEEYVKPTIKMKEDIGHKNLYEFTADDFEVENYSPCDPIKFDISF